MSKRAIISGITGQVGSFLAEALLEKGYEVHGIIRRSSNYNTSRIDHIFDKLKLHYGDLTDSSSLENIIIKVKPTHFFNLAAMSHVHVSWSTPISCQDITGTGVLRILEILKNHSPNTKFIQSSSSEMYGGIANEPINELTRIYPKSPYAASKAYAYYTAINHRESYGLWASNVIMFNCESERRGENFVTRKVTRAATRIKLGLQNKLLLGAAGTYRDWGYCKDYVQAFILVAESEKADDYIVSTGNTHSILEFVELVFSKLDMDYKKYVNFDTPQYMRPAEVNYLLGDSSKIKNALGWSASTSFDELVQRMVDHDLMVARDESILQGIAPFNDPNKVKV